MSAVTALPSRAPTKPAQVFFGLTSWTVTPNNARSGPAVTHHHHARDRCRCVPGRTCISPWLSPVRLLHCQRSSHSMLPKSGAGKQGGRHQRRCLPPPLGTPATRTSNPVPYGSLCNMITCATGLNTVHGGCSGDEFPLRITTITAATCCLPPVIPSNVQQCKDMEHHDKCVCCCRHSCFVCQHAMNDRQLLAEECRKRAGSGVGWFTHLMCHDIETGAANMWQLCRLPSQVLECEHTSDIMM